MTATLLKDVISIPERTGAEDYVLRLTEGVSGDRLEATLSEYVVTDQLTEAFDSALNQVAASVKDGTSRAAFLTGSFGSGKSHFMAVLHALLGGVPAARALEGLTPVVASYDDTLQDKKILRLAFHFLDAKSIEQCVLGGYVEQIRAAHPDAPLPAVHRSDALLQDAERMRERMGDADFFTSLSPSPTAGAASPWAGVLGNAWDLARYNAARDAAPDSPERAKLVDALVRTHFQSFTMGADFVDLDAGLSVISEHAKSLGYDAIVSFLDELVLWLSFRVRDLEFFGREAQKLTKFVEYNSARAIPLVTFVARQFDLRRYFDETAGGSGSDQEAIDQAFRHQEGRFATIELGDGNLPYVAQQRLLRPKDADAARVIDAAFERLNATTGAWDVLLDGVSVDGAHRGADRDAFRRTYPFSPALVATLRTLASAMQRDRTALKVMQQLLVDRRDYLTVDEVIPVGDTFDLVTQGNQAITPEMAGRFKNAVELYKTKFRPMLLSDAGLSEGTVGSVPVTHQFHAHDRLAKTLLLSAIAPEVPALKELTAGRLAALNHGSIVSPLPGKEASQVLSLVRKWSVVIPEIHLSSDTTNPVIRVKVSEVDYESVVAKVRGEDSKGRRQEMVRGLVYEQLGIETADDLHGVARVSRTWRGSPREVEVLFGNVRDNTWLPDAVFRATTGTWRFVIDFPFDEEGHSVREDDARVDSLVAGGPEQVAIWLPHHVSEGVLRDLGRLVILDWLLSGPGDRWIDAARHLPVADRVQAKGILENQRDGLLHKMRRVLLEAYGVEAASAAHVDVDAGHERVLHSLHPELSLQAPVGHDLGAAFDALVDQAFSASFPGHPAFEPADQAVRVADLTRVLEAVHKARQDPDGMARIESADRATLRRVANPLRIGRMGEDRFQFSKSTFGWQTDLDRAFGRDGLQPHQSVTVGDVRGWISSCDPPAGLRKEVTDLVIAAWAALEGRAWYRHGVAVEMPPLGKFDDAMELRPVALPSAEDWVLAGKRAGAIFGIVHPPYLNGAGVAEFAESLRTIAKGLLTPARNLVSQLEGTHRWFSMTADEPTGRLATAQGAATLAATLSVAANDVTAIEALAAATLPTSDEATGRSLKNASTVADAVDSFDFKRLAPLLEGEREKSERGSDAKSALDALRTALTRDEITESLAPALARAENAAFAWLMVGQQPTPEPPRVPTPQPEPTLSGTRTIRSADELARVQEEIQVFVKEHGSTTIRWSADK